MTPGQSHRPLTLVTGASRGIGASIAKTLATRGHDLVLVCRSDREALESVAGAARAANASAHCVSGDVSDPASVDRIFAEIATLPRPLTGLVNNAAYTGERMPLADLPLSELDRVLDTNVRGVLLMCRGAVPLLAKAGGVIVNLTSQSAVFGGNGLTAYAASKAAVNGITVSLAREVAGQGIRVVAVSPGPVKTEPLLALSSERLEEMEKSLPMGRFCSVDDVARTVTWLMSDDASYISGAILPVHGAR
jgi:NAD(P)-dependent dehydrogenase (short-subunit alcohol dehydrogenase family)